MLGKSQLEASKERGASYFVMRKFTLSLTSKIHDKFFPNNSTEETTVTKPTNNTINSPPKTSSKDQLSPIPAEKEGPSESVLEKGMWLRYLNPEEKMSLQPVTTQPTTPTQGLKPNEIKRGILVKVNEFPT